MADTATDAALSAESIVEEETSNRWTFQRITIVSVGAIVAFYVLLFLIGLVTAIAFGERAAAWFSYFRDLINIALAVSTLVIVVGVGVLIVQIARFVNLLRSEVKPITEDTQKALKEVRTTAQFVQKHGVSPIIKGQSFFAGILAFLREIVRITRILQRRTDDAEGGES
jgi:membrane protein implicated in regulation of membrane protease activity